jgi:hypothetical protein
MTEPSLYWADIIFLEPGIPARETRRSIRFLADDDALAVHDAFRWAENRRRTVPESFGKCLCIKVGGFKPERIMADGYLPPDETSFFYEWKYDTGEHGMVRVGAASAMFDKKKG